jgi:hypothetical protein
MIVTITGAYRNAGDHLIGECARSLLRRYVDDDIINIDRLRMADDHYALFNRARAVLLTGGPAYQKHIYPDIYPLDLGRVQPPVIPFGLGWKANIKADVDAFQFNDEALGFVRAVHARIPFSSARDPLTVDVLARAGANNVVMTGCPAWYDLEHLESRYAFCPSPRSVVFSMPARPSPAVTPLLDWLTGRFPRATRTLSFHHGLLPANTARGRETGRANLLLAARALRRGWRVSSLAGSAAKMRRLYATADLHLGYRVHAHLHCLSVRKASVLVNEDARGIAQAMALDAPSVTLPKAEVGPAIAAVERVFETRGEVVARSIERMRERFPDMLRFLDSI